MVKAFARPEKEGFVLVTFFYGDSLGTQARYTDWDQPFLGHTSEPRMSLSIPENTGTFDKRELRIILPEDIFATRASSGVPHSPMYVQIEELTQGLFTGDQSSQKVLYSGRVIRTSKNYQGQNGKVGFFCLPIKSRLDVSMGLPCNHHCAWTLFKGGCGVVAAPISAEIVSQDGTELTVTNGPVLAKGAADARYWKRGYMSKDGLRISIRDYDGATDTGLFYMARPVPTDWLGGSNDIVFTPGCDKTIETCRARWNGEQYFMGLGYAIPAYNPNFETPS
jgi:hypothetical protein